MCILFSFITKGDGKFLFISLEERKRILQASCLPFNVVDSHSYLSKVFVTDNELNKTEDDYREPLGRCDIVNKYEIPVEFNCFSISNVKIDIGGLKVDTICPHINNDTELVKEQYRKFIGSKEFKDIIEFHKELTIKENEKLAQENEKFIKEGKIKTEKKKKELERATKISTEKNMFASRIKKVDKKSIIKLIPKEYRNLINF
jgi:hypothetical protein